MTLTDREKLIVYLEFSLQISKFVNKKFGFSNIEVLLEFMKNYLPSLKGDDLQILLKEMQDFSQELSNDSLRKINFNELDMKLLERKIENIEKTILNCNCPENDKKGCYFCHSGIHCVECDFKND